MKLLRLTATFGCLDHATLEFGPGLTLIEAPNGGGKSTWCAFLRTMLYGLDTRQRDKKGAPADKNRYRPWNGAPMEGLLVCEHEGKRLELRRTSAGGVPMGEFSARWQETGLPVDGMTAETAGELLTGLSQEVFDRSVFLKQTDLAVSQSQELEKKITALVSTGEEDISFTEANDCLKTWLHRRRFHKTGQIPQLEAREEALRQSLDQTTALRQELDQLRTRANSLRRQRDQWESRLSKEQDEAQSLNQKRHAEAAAELDAAEAELQKLQAQQTNPEQQADPEAGDLAEDIQATQDDLASRRRLMTGFVTLIVLFSLCAAAAYAIPAFVLPRFPDFPLQLPEIPLLFVAPIVGGLWVLVLLFAIIKAICDHRDGKELTKLQDLYDQRTQELGQLDQALQEAKIRRDLALRYFDAVSQASGSTPYQPPEAEACRASLHQTEQEIAQLQGQLTALGDPLLIDAELDELQSTIYRHQTDYDALEIAIQALQEADSQLHARFSPQLGQKAGDYFRQLTAGQFDQVSLDRSLHVTVRQTGSLADRPLALLSQGTKDQLYLALRLSIADLVLPEGAACPFVLDDALLAFDDQRLDLALDLLRQLAERRQVILFSCQRREQVRLAGQAGVTVIPLPGA